MDRRGFMRTVAGGIVATSPTDVRAARADTILVRRDLNTFTDQDWADFEACVEALKARAKTDPLGWDKLAEIHNENCPHGNWYFLPWHRAYLYYFEIICRELPNKKSFTLPYWNWTKQPAVPARFLDPKSPLFHPERLPDLEKKRADVNKVGAAALANVMDESDFVLFAGGGTKGRAEKLHNTPEPGAGALEREPHWHVHHFIGRDPAGKAHKTMYTMRAPLDPLFWVHHANVDRLWAKWCYTPPAPGETKEWPAEKYFHELALKFVQVDAAGDTKKVEECLSTYDLGYTYDEFVIGGDPAKKQEVKVAQAAKEQKDVAVAKGDRRYTLSSDERIARAAITAADDFGKALAEHLKAVTEDKIKPPTRARLRVRFSRLPPAGGTVRVFVNNPDANEATKVTDPSYVGYIAFAVPHADEHGGQGAYFALTKSLVRTKLNLKPKGEIPVVLVLGKDGAAVRVDFQLEAEITRPG